MKSKTGKGFKRGSGTSRLSPLIASLTAILGGFAVGFAILLISNPKNAVNGLLTLLFAGMQNRYIGVILYQATPIIMTGLSVSFAYRTGLFNIGTPGQFMVGSFLAVYVSIKATFFDPSSRWIFALLVAALGGGLWGLVPGLLKATRNVNEVISSIMMNYIGMYLVNSLLMNSSIYESTRSMSKPPGAYIPFWGLDKIFPRTGANGGTFIALALAIAAYVLLFRTPFGFELRTCGFNRDAGRYAGIKEKTNLVLAMTIAGALAALGGGLYYLSNTGKWLQTIDALASEGFNGIPVALLAMNNPIGVFFSGIFVSYLNYGGFLTQSYDIVREIVEVVISSIIYCSAFSQAIRLYLAHRKSRLDLSESQAESLSEAQKPEPAGGIGSGQSPGLDSGQSQSPGQTAAVQEASQKSGLEGSSATNTDAQIPSKTASEIQESSQTESKPGQDPPKEMEP